MSNGDSEIPRFSLYGAGEKSVDASIQPTLDLRSWSDVSKEHRNTALQQIFNNGWMNNQEEILGAIAYLNNTYLRVCPGKFLHSTPPTESPRYNSSYFKRREAAAKDFYRIFMEESEPLVLRMLSKFAELLIDHYDLERAKKTAEPDARARYVESAFRKFDHFSNCLNHIFEQFAINQLLTRNGFVPRQDSIIERELYEPTLQALSDPKWKPVNDILTLMFEDFRENRSSEAITKAHSAVHCFLQILVGEPGSNAKGEIGKLMKEGKNAGLIPTNRFTEPFLANIQSFITSERATNSTAKPSLSETSSSDALLMMNMTMLFLQHCLQCGR